MNRQDKIRYGVLPHAKAPPLFSNLSVLPCPGYSMVAASNPVRADLLHLSSRVLEIA